MKLLQLGIRWVNSLITQRGICRRIGRGFSTGRSHGSHFIFFGSEYLYPTWWRRGCERRRRVSGIGVEFAIKKDTLVFVHVMQLDLQPLPVFYRRPRLCDWSDTIVGESLTNDIVTSKIKGRRGLPFRSRSRDKDCSLPQYKRFGADRKCTPLTGRGWRRLPKIDRFAELLTTNLWRIWTTSRRREWKN